MGIASCKVAAKVASDHDKPDGLIEVPPGGDAAFLSPLSVGELPGIGPRTAEVLVRRLGICTVGELAQVKTKPPSFRLTVSEWRALHFSYRRYLENKLREHCDFTGTPIKLSVKGKKKNRK